MEHYRELGIKTPHTWLTHIRQGSQEHPMGKEESLQQIMLGKLKKHMQKKKFGPLSHITHKN